MSSQARRAHASKRCLVTGNGAFVRAAAELPRLSLEDALAICLVLRDSESEVFERAIVRWHARLCRQARGSSAREAQFALAAPQAPDGPAALPALATAGGDRRAVRPARAAEVPARRGAPRRRPDLSQALPAARARTTASSTPSVHGSP
jgi:hypothetical protein